jgi:hypothetical protein
MTDEMTDAKVMGLVRQARALKEKRVAIQAELDDRYDSWGRLAQADHASLGETRFIAGERELDIQRPWPGGYVNRNRPALNTVASLPREHFDGPSLWELLAQREDIHNRLARITAQLKEIDISV